MDKKEIISTIAIGIPIILFVGLCISLRNVIAAIIVFLILSFIAGFIYKKFKDDSIKNSLHDIKDNFNNNNFNINNNNTDSTDFGFCQNCGFKFKNDNQKFCPECGFKLD